MTAGDDRCVACEGAAGPRGAVLADGHGFAVCPNCGTWNIVPRPNEAAQTALHDSSAYDAHPYLAHRRANLEALDRRCAAIFARIGEHVDLGSLRGQRVLDVGCDDGQFVSSAARQFGICPVGVDVAQLAIQQARSNGVEAYHSPLESAHEALTDFPVITAIDVIEHVPDPVAFVGALFGRLRPGGVAYIETPNVASAVYRIGRAMCAAGHGRPAGTCRRLFPPEHIQYFSRAGLHRLAERCGLEIARQESRPLPAREIAVGPLTRSALSGLQLFDRISGEKILRWAIFRRPRLIG